MDKYHSDGTARVLDCCQGDGVMWRALRSEFKIANYWGVDIKPKPGRVKIDSVRLLSQSGWRENVIDIDTYGSPWKHWLALLPNVVRPLTVFLTLGAVVDHSPFGVRSNFGKEPIEAIGLVFKTLKVPSLLQIKVSHLFPSYCIAKALDYRLRLVETQEAVTRSFSNASYFGVRLEPEFMV